MTIAQSLVHPRCERLTTQCAGRVIKIFGIGVEGSGSVDQSPDSPQKNSLPAAEQVHVLHIRKTGGTAIAEALRPVAKLYRIILHDHGTKLSDIPAASKVVFFVRHPVPRFVSGFYSRFRRGLPRHFYDWTENEKWAFSRFRTANDLAEALTSANPQVASNAREAMRSVRHINSSYREWFGGTTELDNRLGSILLVGVQEKLRSDFEYLKKQLGLPDGLSLPADDVLAHRTPPEFDRQLSPLAERNLLGWYADDVRFYEHCLQLRARRGPW